MDDTITLVDCIDGRSTVRRRFDLSDAANGDPDQLVWRPEHPHLLDATLRYAGRHDRDEVSSYTAIRSVGVENGRFQLNGQPLPLRFALDQGYWPRTGQTAPNVDALRHDVEMIRQLGLNGVRKHQKVEDPRWLAFCDELGVLVWEELPSAQRFSPDAVASLTTEWIEIVARDRNHPCIVAWVPANESWGVPEVSRDRQQRSLIDALASLTAALDPTRPVSANDGWETSGGEIVGIHDYTHDADVMSERYGSVEAVDALFAGPGPEGKALTVDGRGRDGRAVVLSETGGTTFGALPAGAYVYGQFRVGRRLAPRHPPALPSRPQEPDPQRILLDAAHRHVSGDERPAPDGPVAQGADRTTTRRAPRHTAPRSITAPRNAIQPT